MAIRRSQHTSLRSGKNKKRGVIALAAAAAVAAIASKGAAFVSSATGAVTVQRTSDATRRGLIVSSSRSRLTLKARGGADDDDEYDPIRLGVRMEDLKSGEELQGVVTRVEPYGCFVDVDEENGKLGYIPVSKMYPKRSPENIFGDNATATLDEKQAALEEIVKVGKGVTVYHAEVTERGQMRMSLYKEKAFPAGQRRGGGGGAPVSKDVTPFQAVAATEWLEGKVDGIMSYGAFVITTAPTGEQASGLVPITQIKDGFIEDINNELKIGDEVKVRVVEVSAEKSRLSLTMLTEEEVKAKAAPRSPGGGGGKVDLTPFEAVAATEWLEGAVDGIQDYGAFVSVTAPGGEKATGLVPIAQVKDGFVNDISEELSMGQAVKVRVVNVDTSKNRLGLTMLTEEEASNKPARRTGGGGGGGAPSGPRQDVSKLEGVSESEWLEGKVVSIENFGAFVEFKPPSGGDAMRGLVYIKDIADEFVEDPYDFIEEDMDVKVRVVKVDKEKGQVGLSMIEAKPVEA
eukprot:TRINITY_DN5045_c0_g2_i1.p1 TRINITY_DN5045_c0_g2~~TRINITY_DN5045_c0_g2_i1.p1  ORF type:complete len:539 (+),score=161.02 TRINITY_DN5045_c0_g2_i1:71-1618(+)